MNLENGKGMNTTVGGNSNKAYTNIPKNHGGVKVYVKYKKEGFSNTSLIGMYTISGQYITF